MPVSNTLSITDRPGFLWRPEIVNRRLQLGDIGICPCAEASPLGLAITRITHQLANYQNYRNLLYYPDKRGQDEDQKKTPSYRTVFTAFNGLILTQP
ncbi:uncharacterized protein APUU_30128A [Aspergillus puulaauensis]|uniref:Uncharacterized protein n=1 Tax=Aspergillus puulaauensis TaxID=1220207 RepID=A0A7R7XJ42_9EURO|nr:uncharacterized protein APUU_30128A [Aspergillus puulaauensis]BCS21903.1 hypothetical protein APUU_30128A [Aspergillus puulaauensis]